MVGISSKTSKKYAKLGKITVKHPTSIDKPMEDHERKKEGATWDYPKPNLTWSGKKDYTDKEKFLKPDDNGKYNDLGNVPTFEVELKYKGPKANMKVSPKDSIRILGKVKENLLKYGPEYANSGCYCILLKPEGSTKTTSDDCNHFRYNLLDAWRNLSNQKSSRVKRILSPTLKIAAGVGAAAFCLLPPLGFGITAFMSLMTYFASNPDLSQSVVVLGTYPFWGSLAYGAAIHFDREKKRNLELYKNYTSYEGFQNVQVTPYKETSSTAPPTSSRH